MSTTRRCSLLLVAALTLAGACGGRGNDPDPQSAGNSVTGAVDPTLDCVTQGYPCTWGEVDPSAVARSANLAGEAMTRLNAGQGTTAVAGWLEKLPDVGEVLHDSLLIRFRLTSGRPVWVGTPDAAALGIRGAGQGAPSTRQADPVGAQTPGVRPEKAFLFVDPYRYEFYLDVEAGIIPVENDASRSLPKLFANVRDYKCTPGRTCGCPDGQCFKYVGNDWKDWCDPSAPDCQVVENVTLDDFKSWRSYDAIHVASHGSRLCNPWRTVCGGGIASGRFVRGDIKAMADAYKASQMGVPPAFAYWLTEPGIELYALGFPPGACERLTSGTPGYSFAHCDTQAQVWRVYLGTDFFKAVYKPGDLKDKLIFLNTCVSVHEDATLAKYLAGPADENAVVGWDGYVRNSAASKAAMVFYKEWLAGKTAYEAFQIAQSDEDLKDLSFLGGRGILRGAQSPLSGPPPAPRTEGLVRKRGVETIRLLDPATGVEIPDGGTLPLAGGMGDGDLLDALIEVVGVDAEEDPARYAITVRVDGHDAPGSAAFNGETGPGTHRYRGPLGLGVDLKPERPVNVEVSASLPDGGETRWLYYDLVPRHTWWEVAVTGGPVAFPVLSGRRVRRQMHVALGLSEGPGPEPDLTTLPSLTIALRAGQAFVEGPNTGSVTVHFRELGYTCSGFSHDGFRLAIAGVKPLDGAFEGRVICTPGNLADPARFKQNFRQRFEAHAVGRFRAR